MAPSSFTVETLRPSSTAMVCAVRRTRSPSRWTAPPTTQVAPSRRPSSIACRSSTTRPWALLSSRWTSNICSRGMALSPCTLAKSMVNDSAMPWPIHSSAGLPVRLAKVSTATVRPLRRRRGGPKPTGGMAGDDRIAIRAGGGQQPLAGVVQVDVDLAGRLVAECRVLGQRLAHHRVHVGRHRVVEAGQRLGLLGEDAVGGVGHRRRLERRAAGQHLVEHRAQREEVGAVVHLAAAQLLGRHVVERAEHQAGDGEPAIVSPLAGLRELGQAEVEHLDQLPAGHA